MVVRANILGMGYSALRFSVANTLLEMVNKDVTPYVRQKGSLGASGDLAPMSEITAVMIGYGKAYYKGELMPGKEAMEKAGIPIVTLSYKEGLALINGPHMMAGASCVLLVDARSTLKQALIASAMSIDALMSIPKPFDPRVHNARPFSGQIHAAQGIRKIFEGSEIMTQKSGRVQDGYSVRCTPQVIGPSIDAVEYALKQIEIEINSASDNPLVFINEGDHIEAGNFHGQSTAMAMDFGCIGLAEIANLSERHVNRLLNPSLSNGLPDFLVEGKGLNSGLMIAQYTAAAMVSENKVLSHPAVVDSIPVSADQEDHVSMGPISVSKFNDILKNVRGTLAIEMFAAAQALDFRKPLKPGRGVGAAYEAIRKHVTYIATDREINFDMEKIYDLIVRDEILNAVETEVGEIELGF